MITEERDARFHAEAEFRDLGTNIYLQIVTDPQNTERALNDLGAAKDLIREKKQIFDRFDAKSELSQLNSHLNKARRISKDLQNVIRLALEFYTASNGLFDPRVITALEKIGYDRDFKYKDSFQNKSGSKPNSFHETLLSDLKIKKESVKIKRRIDLGGIAKGWIADRASAFFKRRGWKNFLVDLGGDIFASGLNKYGVVWSIGIEGIPDEKLLIDISGQGIATSGTTRKKWNINDRSFHHLIHPTHPFDFSFELSSVTVVAANAVTADAWAKILFLMGQADGMAYAEEHGIACVFLMRSGTFLISSELKKYKASLLPPDRFHRT